ncbi:hypothetical protein CGMCC3_g7732 [Colletotrichum fructicola]|nr:uncharacterized protein CGMCC3_g7732 [Colletotrichum fructicola]KAE9576066.1 hypothetical protein CGMCC3_g7732 [Colletotrichum fructicola]
MDPFDCHDERVDMSNIYMVWTGYVDEAGVIVDYLEFGDTVVEIVTKDGWKPGGGLIGFYRLW